MQLEIFKSKKFLFLIVLSMVLVSCSSDDGSEGDGEFIIATVETISFESRGELQSGPTAAKIDGGQFITFIIQGTDNASNVLAIIVPEYDGPGTYNLGFDNENSSGSGLFSTQQGEAWSSSNEGGLGSITILTDTAEETTGRFEFVGISETDASSRNVSNGSFRIDFETQ